MLSQPVAAREVAHALVRLAGQPPAGWTPDLAGPEQLQMTHMVRRLARVRGLRRLVVPVRLPGAVGRQMAGGALLPDPGGSHGRLTYQQWLDTAAAEVSRFLTSGCCAGCLPVAQVNDVAELGAAYAAARPRLIRVAYAVLGSLVEAEDAVSDTWLRPVEADQREPVRDVEGWAVIAVAHRALDVLRSARVRRETYIGPWLPEPVLGPSPGNGLAPYHRADRTAPLEPLDMPRRADVVDPVDRVTLDDTIGYALLVVLESLTPPERTAWVLHDLFGVPFHEVAQAVGRSPAAVRQLAARARRHVNARAPRRPVDPQQHHGVVNAFLAAAAGGDLPALLTLLDPDVTVTSDGGGHVSAARRPVHGSERAARFLLGLWHKQAPHAASLEIRAVNGLPGLAVHDAGRLVLIGPPRLVRRFWAARAVVGSAAPTPLAASADSSSRTEARPTADQLCTGAPGGR